MGYEMVRCAGGTDYNGDTVRLLQRENNELRAELANARAELAQRKLEAAASLNGHMHMSRSVEALQKQLSPLYRAMQAVFGDIESAIGTAADSAPSAPQVSPNVSFVWAAWKVKFPGVGSKIIDALLVHGEMSTTQLKIVCQAGTSTITNGVSKLNGAGLINKNGGRFSLKQL